MEWHGAALFGGTLQLCGHSAHDADAGATPETTAMIGDTSFDIDMGLAAGARAIGVGWGYHPAQELTAAGAHGVAMDSMELRRHIGAP